MKILYAGSPEASKQSLQFIFERQAELNIEIVGVITNPASAQGRHKDLIPTPVAQFAIEKGIPVFCPEHLDAASREEIKVLNADLLVSFAYGHIFGPKFLGLFPLGGINLHPSLLPKYRGCTPVNAAILNRDKLTAVSIQNLSLKMDEGDILSQRQIELNMTETGESLLLDCAKIGGELLCELLKEISTNNKVPQGIPQSKIDQEISYTGIIKKEDARINWNNDAKIIEAEVRAYFPEPGCWCVEKNQNLRILKSKVLEETDVNYAEFVNLENFQQMPCGTVLAYNKALGIIIKTGKNLLCVTELQRQGKKAMNYKDFMNGARDFIGTILL